MSKIHGKNAAFLLDNLGGSLINLSTHGDNTEMERISELADVTAYGDAAHKFVVGLADGKFTASGSYDGAAAAIDAHLSGIFGLDATQSFEYGPEGSTSGKVKYSGECRLANYKVSSPATDKVTWEAEFQADGAITRGTFA